MVTWPSRPLFHRYPQRLNSFGSFYWLLMINYRVIRAKISPKRFNAALMMIRKDSENDSLLIKVWRVHSGGATCRAGGRTTALVKWAALFYPMRRECENGSCNQSFFFRNYNFAACHSTGWEISQHSGTHRHSLTRRGHEKHLHEYWLCAVILS